ncbi:MAG: hypothetical protein M3Y08_12335 [Fibrobacterota bacterium]|nr:hypothetical protein [Fibrobacterota bacterium]
MIPYRLWTLLAFSRIPGNAFSFWIRQTLRWSRGRPKLSDEGKEGLFDYLAQADGSENGPPPPLSMMEAGAKERALRERYHLDDLYRASTRALYRKNLYLIDILEKAAEGLPIPDRERREASALDIGSQDWHYVFALERWLRHGGGAEARRVSLKGVEVDGYGIYPDFRSRKDYALAYAAQTGNPEVTYEVRDFLRTEGGGRDIVTLFYPFVTRHHLLLWGLPLRYFQPARMMTKVASILKPGGWLLVFTHTLKEHRLYLELGRASGAFTLAKEGRALSALVDFHEDVEDRRFSVWRRKDD